jgi:3-oxoacyl-[acyl-carrier-protein] synthase II
VRRVVLTACAAVEGAGESFRDAVVDANRLRRMDRFGRSGVLAGARALSAAGIAPAPHGTAPDARFGVVVGTAYGCHDAVTQHERLLARAAGVSDLAPSVFAATVHNSVSGELAIVFGLGGPAETLVSGCTAGLEALVLAASRVAKGDADRVLVVAAEGIDDAMRAAFLRENPAATLVESSGAVLLEAEEEQKEGEEEISLSKRKRVLFVGADLTFADEGAAETTEERPEDFLEGVGRGLARGSGEAVKGRVGASGIEPSGAPRIERLGASGLWEIARDVLAFTDATGGGAPVDAPDPHSPSQKIRNRRYTARDVHGSHVAVTLAFFS